MASILCMGVVTTRDYMLTHGLVQKSQFLAIFGLFGGYRIFDNLIIFLINDMWSHSARLCSNNNTFGIIFGTWNDRMTSRWFRRFSEVVHLERVPFRRKRYIVRHQNNWPIPTTPLLLLAVFLSLDQILEVLNYSKYNIHWRHHPRPRYLSY